MARRRDRAEGCFEGCLDILFQLCLSYLVDGCLGCLFGWIWIFYLALAIRPQARPSRGTGLLPGMPPSAPGRLAPEPPNQGSWPGAGVGGLPTPTTRPGAGAER